MPVPSRNHINASNFDPAIKKVLFDLTDVDAGVTATASGTQATSYKINKAVTQVSTVATAADALLLPTAEAGTVLRVINGAAANSMGVFPGVGAAVNALSANAVFAIAANKMVEFVCVSPTQWYTNLTA
jgi:hypothetical protein